MYYTGFADEASQDIDQQIKAAARVKLSSSARATK